MAKILICGKLSSAGLDLLSQEKSLDVHVEKDTSFENLKKIVDQYDGMTVRSDTQVTQALLECAKNLKVVVRAGIGVDNVDVKAATKKGVLVMNTPSGNTITTAEHAVSMLLSLCRHIPQATQSLKEGRWDKKKYTGVEVFGKTMGVIGLGNVGRIVADRAFGLKMKVVAYDPFISKESAQKQSVELVSLDDLYQRSDFISVHVPLNDKTKNLVDKTAFSKMKKEVLLVQCARGGIVNEADLYDALKKGQISGAALDVFVEEPPGKHPLLELSNVICTPHLGAATGEAQIKVGIETAEQLIGFFTKGIIKNSINMPSVSGEQLSFLKPYLDLAEKIGSFQGQIMDADNLNSIHIEYCGNIIDYDLKTLTLTIVTGFLRQILEKSVNYVNALLVAQERGIAVKTTTSNNTSEFTSLIKVTVKSEHHEWMVAGTIFNATEPRFVQINNFFLEAVPNGNILFCRNKNEPGVIGTLGTRLGEEKINISRFQLGLDEKKGEAVSLINVDSPIKKDVLKKLLALPHILTIKQVVL